jgi:uncharacterized protein YegP (UPF0339 family)
MGELQMPAARFEITRDEAGKYRFHLRAGNGEIVAASQEYARKANAEKGIQAVKKATDAEVVDLTDEAAKK